MNIIKKIKYKFKYKNCKIANSVIEDGAKLISCTICNNCDIRKNVLIDENSYINNNCNIISAIIGKYCSIGYNVDIGMFEHPIDFVSTSPKIYKNNSDWNEISNPPIIKNDVWIGSQAVILQGVTIGNGAVIASGAVVTKDVPPYAIVGGVPAKVIKYRFSQETIDKLQKIEWWNKDSIWINKNLYLFNDVERFIGENDEKN